MKNSFTKEQIIDGFLFAISYFTTLPTFKKELALDKNAYTATLFFTPFCGLIIALITLLFFNFLNIYLNIFYTLIVTSIFYLFLYGFLHLEAIADVIDAWMAKYSNKDIYEILKEPQIGSIGAIGTFCFILLKICAIGYLLYEDKFELFILVVVFSRLTIIYSIKFFDFHENSIFAKTLKSSTSNNLLIVSTLFYIAIGILLVGFKSAFMLFFISILSSILILKILKKRFSFLNGDCIGFSIEFCELLLLNIAILL